LYQYVTPQIDFSVLMRLSKKTDFKAVTCQVKAGFLISSKLLLQSG
jgi:hypothetical protein